MKKQILDSEDALLLDKSLTLIMYEYQFFFIFRFNLLLYIDFRSRT